MASCVIWEAATSAWRGSCKTVSRESWWPSSTLIEATGCGAGGRPHAWAKGRWGWLTVVMHPTFFLRQVDKNVEREILNHRMLNHPNIIGFKEVRRLHAAVCHRDEWMQARARR